MAFDWSKFLTAVIPAGIGAAGALAGNRAKASANAQSKETIENAYRQALDAFSKASGQATDINNWMLQSSFAPLNFGYSQSRSDLGNALANAQAAIQGGTADIGSILGPYTSAGKRGAEETNFLLYGQRPGAQTPSAPTAGPNPGSFQLPPNFGGGFNIAPPPSMAPGAPGAPGASSTNLLTSFAPHLADNKVAGSKAAGIAGTAAGIGGNFLPGLGPIAGAGLGGLTSGLISRLTRKGREKEAASDAVNEHSDWFWNDVVPTAQREGWSGDQLKAVANQGWNDYSNWINQNLGDKKVAQTSLDSQKSFFDQGLKTNPYTSQFYQ